MNKRGGFLTMTPERRREVCSKGGRAAHQNGTAFEWTSDQAVAAGSKGGLASQAKRREKLLATEKGVDTPRKAC